MSSDKKSSVYENTNGFPLANGKNLHMDVGFGDLANRIVTVGAVSRLEKVAKYLDTDSVRFRHTSSRGFTSITGTFSGVPVSIVAIGMGISMMDFFVRESRAVVDGPMAVIRFGTCGGLSEKAPTGSVVVASKGAAMISRNPDSFTRDYSDSVGGDNIPLEEAYTLSMIAPASTELSSLVIRSLGDGVGSDRVVEGTNVTADSFYSSQGRIDDNFDDCNENLIADYVLRRYPDAGSMEMESFSLLHLAKCAKKPIFAAATAIVVANRCTADVIPGDLLEHIEDKGGEAMLKALTAFEM